MTSMAGHGVAGLVWAVLGMAPLLVTGPGSARQGQARQVTARRGLAPLRASRQVLARLVRSRQVLVRLGRGKSWLPFPRQVLSRPGRVGLGPTRLGKAGPVLARRDSAPLWLGPAGQSTARHGGARRGRSRFYEAPLDASRHVKASLIRGVARPGRVRPGAARLGAAGRGKAWLSFPGLGKASLLVARRVLARPVAAWQRVAGHVRARLPFKKRNQVNEQLVERIRPYTFGGSR